MWNNQKQIGHWRTFTHNYAHSVIHHAEFLLFLLLFFVLYVRCTTQKALKMFLHNVQTVNYGKYTVGWILFWSQNLARIQIRLCILYVIIFGQIAKMIPGNNRKAMDQRRHVNPCTLRSVRKSACFRFSILSADLGMWYAGMESISIGQNMVGHRYLALTVWVSFQSSRWRTNYWHGFQVDQTTTGKFLRELIYSNQICN